MFDDKRPMRWHSGLVSFVWACVFVLLPVGATFAAGDGPDEDEITVKKNPQKPATVVLPAPPKVVHINPDVSRALAVIQQLREEIKGLRNTVDLLTFRLEKLERRQRDLYNDLDDRLRRQERASAELRPHKSTDRENLPVTNQLQTEKPTIVPATDQLQTQTLTIAPATDEPQTETLTIVPGTDEPQTETLTIVPAIDLKPVTAVAASGDQQTVVVPSTVADVSQDTTLLPSSIVVGSVITSLAPQPETSITDDAQGAAITAPNASANQSLIASTGIVTATEKEAYDKAFSLLKQSRYADAAIEFEKFLREHSAGGLKDDAWYWMAEARYVMREFEKALNGYRTIVTYFPDSSRVPAAMLKIGYIQYDMAAYGEARQTLTDLLQRFAAHRVAVAAESRLKKMEREGR